MSHNDSETKATNSALDFYQKYLSGVFSSIIVALATFLTLAISEKINLFSFKDLLSSSKPGIEINPSTIYDDKEKLTTYKALMKIDLLENLNLVVIAKGKNLTEPSQSSSLPKLSLSVTAKDSIPCQVWTISNTEVPLSEDIKFATEGQALYRVKCEKLKSSQHELELQLRQLSNKKKVPIVVEVIGNTESGQTIGNGIEFVAK